MKKKQLVKSINAHMVEYTAEVDKVLQQCLEVMCAYVPRMSKYDKLRLEKLEAVHKECGALINKDYFDMQSLRKHRDALELIEHLINHLER